jgi:predicted permease
VSVQVALSMIALSSAGLFIHSLRNVARVAPGFETQNEAVMLLDLDVQHYSQLRAEEFYRNVIERLRGLPTVGNASLADVSPLKGSFLRTTFTDNVDRSDPANGKLNGIINVEPGFFAAAGIPFLRGRDFSEFDDPRGRMVAVVNETAAQRMWSGEDPLGKQLHFLLETWDVEVVGVVKTAKWESLSEEPQPIIYFPLKQHYTPFVCLYIRTNANPNTVLPSVLAIVRSLDSKIEPAHVRTGEQILDESLTTRRIGAELLGAFGALALILALIGIYGVMAYSVSQRTQEVGIRMALGAQPGDVFKLLIGRGMVLSASGMVAGLVAALLLTRVLSSLLFGVSPHDPITFGGVTMLLGLVALLACYVPARRATRIDPMVALRYE